MPLVSVIVPVYNAEKYIGDCIDSIQAQTFEDWELILVDDGSPDKSGAICDEYAQNDSRISVMHKNNEGVSAARNSGLTLAKGKYLSFVDADDYVLPTYLSDMLEHPADVVVTGCVNRYDDLSSPDRIRSIVGCGFYSMEKGNLGQGMAQLEMNFCWASPCAKLFLREVVVAHNINFKASLDYGEDHIFNMEYGKYVTSISFLAKYNYVYMHRNAMSLTNRMVPSKTMFAYIVDLYHRRVEYAQIFDFDGTAYFGFVKQELCAYYWQTVYTVLKEKQYSDAEVKATVERLYKELPKDVLFSSKMKLPLTYRILQTAFKYFSISFSISLFRILFIPLFAPSGSGIK